MCGFQGTQKPYTISGDNGERDPPVPIPNTEVKPFSADGTWLETTWESRTLPDSTKKSLRRCLGLFLCASRQVLLPCRFQANVQHCTWLGSPMCAAGGGSSTWGNTWESRGKARKKLCASVTSISLVVFDECATLYLVRIFSAARCAGFRQKNFPSPRLRITSKHMSK